MDGEWFERLQRAIQKALDGGLRPTDIADRVGVNRNMPGDILNKGTVPKVDNFLKICEAIDVDPIEILTGLPSPSPAVSKALQLFSRWPLEEQESFLEWIEKHPSSNYKSTSETLQDQAGQPGR